MAVFDAADWIWPDVGSGWLLDVNPSSPLAEALLSALTADSAAFGRPAILSSTLAVAPDRRFIGNARVGNGAGVLSAPIPSTTVKQWTLFASFSLSFTNVEKAAAGVGGGSSSPLLSLHHVSNSAKMRVWARNDSGSNPAATVYTFADVFDGLPHDVALIFDGSTLSSVVDGVEDATCAWSAGNFTINRHAICGSWRSGSAYNPSAASVYRSLFFDRALSIAEIRELPSQDAGGLFCSPLRGVYMPYWAPSASGATISGSNSATTFSTAAISNGASVSGVTPAQPTTTGELVSGSTISATCSVVTSSSASVTATVPGATIEASGSAVTGSSGDLRAQGSVSGAGAAVTSSAGAVTAGTNAAAIAGAGSAVPGSSGVLLSASAMAAVNAASPSATGAVASRSSLAGASQAVTGGTAAITSGSAPSAAIVATTSAFTRAVALLIARASVNAMGAARASGSATLSTGAPDTPGELILSELKIATISVSALKFATIDAEVLNNG